MRRRAFAVVAAVATLALPSLALAQPVSDTTLGAPIATVVKTRGFPASVTTSDNGHAWTWKSAAGGTFTVMTDDDGIVRATDQRPVPDDNASASAEIDGRTRRFPFFVYTAANADAQLSANADFALADQRAYRVRENELVLVFGGPGGTLDRVLYGERPTVARLGFLPSEAAAIAALNYKAPKPRRLGALPGATAKAKHPAVVREEIDRSGNVKTVTIAITSDEPAADTAAKSAAAADSWQPATIAGKPIGTVVFREVGP